MCLVPLLLVFTSPSPGFSKPAPRGRGCDIAAPSPPVLLSCLSHLSHLAQGCKSYFTYHPAAFSGKIPIVWTKFINLSLIYKVSQPQANADVLQISFRSLVQMPFLLIASSLGPCFLNSLLAS